MLRSVSEQEQREYRKGLIEISILLAISGLIFIFILYPFTLLYTMFIIGIFGIIFVSCKAFLKIK